MGRVPQWQVSWQESVSSTMDLAREAARGVGPSGQVFAAREQTEGRGRSGRGWVSPPGGLYASVLLREPPKALAPLLPFCGGLAVQRGLSGLVPDAMFRLKWPNDVLVMGAGAGAGRGAGGEDAKVAGVLTEAGAVGARLMWAVIGFGVNVDVEELPQGVDPPAVGLSWFASPCPAADAVLRSVLDALDGLLEAHWSQPKGLVDAVLPVLAYHGERVRVGFSDGREELVGVLEGLDAVGNALVRSQETESQPVRVAAWDVHRLRPA